MIGKRKYVTFNPVSGYPAGKDLSYECSKCGDVIPSIPTDVASCSCRNIVIDTDAGRVSVKDDSQMKIFK